MNQKTKANEKKTKQMKRNSATKHRLFEKTNKIDKQLPKLIKVKEKSQSSVWTVKGNVTTGAQEQSTLTNISKILDKMDKFLGKCNTYRLKK